MRSTFLAFHTASRAMAASQANIDVTGNNISNVNTDGYTRQRVDLNSISLSGKQKYAVSGSRANVGIGVEVSNISQIRDPFLDARFRKQNAENGKYDTLLSGLSDLELVFDEIDVNGLQSELSSFINQLQTFSQTPTSKDIAMVVRTAAQKVTEILNVFAKQTQEVKDQQVFDLKNVVVDNSFNTTVKAIAELNTQIREELIHGNTPNELYDKRNTLIDNLSNMANIKVITTPEKVSENLTIENLSISIYDPATSTSIGIVKNGLYNTLSVNESGENVKIEINSCFGDFSDNDITKYISGGSIKGYLDLINGNGAYANTAAGENGFRGAMYYKNTMDTFAANFAQLMNDLNTDASGTVKPLFKATDGSGSITAGNIAISDEWLADSTFITTTLSTSTVETGSADNILRMISALKSDMKFYRNASDPNSQVMFEGTMAEYLTGFTGELALDIELNKNFSDTANSVLNNLYTSRESISGVNMDEEGINLMAYQKSYNAAARYFTVLDEAVDTIINNMGIVGR